MELEVTPRPDIPWLAIWVRPRQTMREILDYDPNYLIVPLVVLISFSRGLEQAMSQGMGDESSLAFIAVFVLVLAPIAITVAIHVWATILTAVGRLLGGQGDFIEVRSAVVWSWVPQILAGIGALLAILMMGAEAFMSETPLFDARIDQAGAVATILYLMVFTFISVSSIAASLWSIILGIGCLAVAHRFSIWRAIATLIMPGIVITFVVVFVMIISGR